MKVTCSIYIEKRAPMLSAASDTFSQTEHLPDGEAQNMWPPTVLLPLPRHRPPRPPRLRYKQKLFQAQFKSYGGCL